MNPSNTVSEILAAHCVPRDLIQNNIWKSTFEYILETNRSLVNIALKDLMIIVIVGDISDNVNIINEFFAE